MEQRTWRWTDAHFCSLPSQTNIYGCTKLFNPANGTNKLLVASLVGKFFTIDYQRIFDKLTPSTKEVQFTYIPGDSEIVSVDATNKSRHGNGLTIGITFWKLEENESKQFLHLYYASQLGEEFNLELVAQGCQSLELLFVPYHLTHTELVVGDISETVFMLSGSDSKIHLYREINYQHRFKEYECVEFFPELDNLPSVVLWLDILYFCNNTRRITACGHQNGCVTISVVDVEKREIMQSYSVDHDSPITYVKVFTLHNEVSKPPFLSSHVEESSKKEVSVPEFNVLVLSALIPATVYRDVLRHGLREPVFLPDSNKFDAVLTGCIIDIDFDGENEILIGTYGQEVLAYKLSSHAMSRSHKVSSMSDLDDAAIKFRHLSGENELSTTPKFDYKSSRRVKSQENLSSSLNSDADYIPMSSSKDTVISKQQYHLLNTQGKSLSNEQLKTSGCKLLWQRSFACPVIGINRMDIMGDGMEDLVIVTLKGLHILQPDLNEVATVCLERLRILASEQDKGLEMKTKLGHDTEQFKFEQDIKDVDDIDQSETLCTDAETQQTTCNVKETGS